MQLPLFYNEAFTAADPGRFPSSLPYEQKPGAKRILWNTYNFEIIIQQVKTS